jgi:hypothetical protein
MSEISRPAALEAIVSGVFMLAEEDLATGNAPAALILLDASPFVDDEPWAARAASLRVPALLAAGKVEDAARYPADLAVWWRGFELAKATSKASVVAAALLDRFDGELDAARREQLATLALSSELVGPPEPR